MYNKVSTDLNFVEREKNTLKFWNENKIFEKSIEGDLRSPFIMVEENMIEDIYR